jgi:DNA-binding response OmpR family regulator
MSDYLSKPIDQRELVTKIKTALASRECSPPSADTTFDDDSIVPGSRAASG